MGRTGTRRGRTVWTLLAVMTALMLAVGQWGGSGPKLVGATAAEAQQQVLAILPDLINSEAENADGAYIPGVGAVFTLEVVRGPNDVEGKTAAQGTLDWAVYLMQAFGPQLTAIPPDEVIAFSIRFFDYETNLFHLLVVSAAAQSVAAFETYQITLDGEPFSNSGAAPISAGTEPVSPPTATPAAAVTTLPAATPQPLDLALGFEEAADADAWLPVAGIWGVAEDQSYRQTALGLYDLVSYYETPTVGEYTLSVDLLYVDGRMGGGLVFNAPDPTTKNLAQMVSFAGGGTFLQWGSYDAAGVFQYQGGMQVSPGAADGVWHSLAVRVSASTYSVILDGKEVASAVPLNAPPGGYFGLLASTSAVAFDNVTIESAAS